MARYLSKFSTLNLDWDYTIPKGICQNLVPNPTYIFKKSVLRIRIWIWIRRIHMFLGLSDPDLDPLVRGMDPDPDPALDPAPDPSTIMQK